MLRNYFVVAIRNLLRNKTFSGINVLGLAIGMAASLLIYLWIKDERGVGTHYPRAAQLYRVMEHEIADGRVVTDEDTPGILADELKKQFPEITHAAGLSWPEQHVLQVGNKTTRQTGYFAGADWLAMYGIPVLAGSVTTALTTPDGMAISRKLAVICFGTPEQALGKTIRLDAGNAYRVMAVFEDLPAPAPEQYEFLLNWQSFLQREPWTREWSNTGPQTRLLLRADADPARVNAQLRTFLKGRNKDIGPSYNVQLFLQPETEAYLYSRFKDGQRAGGRIEYVRVFGVVAAFLLLIAGINFVNLATARSVKRAREVGVRKVVGAARASLIGQFMGEALLLTLLALAAAVALVGLLLPAFNQLTDKHLSLGLGELGILLGLLVLMTGLAGGYPALFLSALNPVRVLKGTLRVGAGAQQFRRGLVTFQFVLSLLLIVGTLVVYRQLQYIQTKNLGYDRANLISVRGEGETGKNYPLFKQELLRQPGIQSVTFSTTGPLGNGNTTDGVTWTGKDPTAAIQFNNTSVDYDFAKTMGIRLASGRDFSPAFGTDSTNYLINQAAAQRMGYPDPVGQPLTFWGKPGKIVGVLQDYHFNSLHVAIRPIIVRLQKDNHYGNVLVRTQPGQTRQALASLEATWRKLNPNFPFTYAIIDADYQQLYRSEAVVSTLAVVFAGLAIFIACLGLFGLAAFTAEQRTKEIGIRKVLGASVGSIVALLSQDFLRLVLIAFVIATPLAWYVTGRWLENYAYRTPVSWWLFALAGGLAFLIALLTVSYQAIRAARANPVKSLRTE